MLILDQSKSNIVNVERTINIGIEEESTLTDVVTILAESDGYSIVLGRYENEERAKKVLQEILNKYRQWNMDKNNAVTTIPKVYEMPEK